MAFAVRRPVVALIAVAATLAAAAAILVAVGLRVDDGADVFVVKGGRSFAVWTRFQEDFGQGKVTVMGIGGPDPLGPTGLQRLDDVVAKIGEIDREIQSASAAGRSIIERVSGLHAVPLARRLMREDRPDEVRALPLLGSLMVVGVDDSPLVLLTVEHPTDLSSHERVRWAAGVKEIGAWIETRDGTCDAIGRPLVEAALARASADQGRVLFPLLGLVAFLCLFAVVKSLSGTLLVFGTTIVTLPVTLAIMMLTGHQLNLLTNGLPVVLLVLCSTVSLHVLRAVLRQDPQAPPREAAARAARVVVGPAFAASLTTAFGFLALTSSDIGPVREMGAFAALGIVVSYFVATTLIPAAAALGWVPRRGAVAAANRARSTTRAVTPVILVTGVVILVSAVGASDLDIQSSAISYLPVDDPVARAHAAFEDDGVPIRSIELSLGGVPRLYFASPKVLAHVAGYGQRISEVEGVARVASIVDALALVRVLIADAVAGTADEPAVARAFADLDAEHAGASDDPGQGVALAPVLALLMGEGDPPPWFEDLDAAQLDDVRRLLEPWIGMSDPGSGAVRIQVGVRTADTAAIQRVTDEVLHILGRSARDVPGLRAEATGAALLGVKAQTELITSQVASLILAFALVAAVLIIALASWRLVLIAAVPNLIPLALLYGGMGWLGIGVDAATVMVGAIALGIAVDDTVHLLAFYDPKLPSEQAVAVALDHVRWPVVATTIMTAAGFSVLGFSDFAPMARFGLLTAAAMVLALIADLIVLPALLLKFGLPQDRAELLHFTDRGKFARWSTRTPSRWFNRIALAWRDLKRGSPDTALKKLDEFLGHTRSLPESPRVHRARGAASYWRLRCLEALAARSEDPAVARSFQSALGVHRDAFEGRYGDLEDISARVRRIP